MKPPQIELPKSLIWIALLILISIVVIGCRPEVVVRDRQVKIPVPIYIDTLNGYGQDTVYAERIVKGDTVTSVKYIPLLKKFYIKVKPDSVIIHDIDTLKIIKKEVVEMKWYSKLGLILIGCGVMGIIAFAVFLLRK